VSEDAGLDIDYDAELARLQGIAAGVEPPEPAAIEVAGKIVIAERTVELNGRRFRIADKIGLMPLLKFSAFADVAVQDGRALGALYAMLRDCIHPGTPACGKCSFCAPSRCGECGSCRMAADGEGDDGDLPCTRNRPDPTGCKDYDPGDWRAFEDWACESKAEADDLMDVVTGTIELIAGRPTAPPPGSSPSRRGTRGASTARSSGRRGRGSRR
jgi:hypothetical protein